MTGQDERFLLDATVSVAINSQAFRARLGNGHEFVAFRGAAEAADPLGPGDRVQVEMSPYDMSKGRITGRPHGDGHEGA